jgi:quercetin dioxygenase-like cupin family protein
MADENWRGFVIGRDEGRTLRNPAGGLLTFKARGSETAGSLTAFETSAAPGEGPPVHRHAKEDEVLYVLEGELRVVLHETLHEAPAGSFVFIPKGTRHVWQNVSDAPTRFLVFFAPAALGMEQFFERSADLADDVRLAESFKQFASDAGMEVLGPPLAQSNPR